MKTAKIELKDHELIFEYSDDDVRDKILTEIREVLNAQSKTLEWREISPNKRGMPGGYVYCFPHLAYYILNNDLLNNQIVFSRCLTAAYKAYTKEDMPAPHIMTKTQTEQPTQENEFANSTSTSTVTSGSALTSSAATSSSSVPAISSGVNRSNTNGLQNSTASLGTASTSSTTIPPSYSGSGSANFNMMRMFGNMQTGAIQHTGMPITSSSSVSAISSGPNSSNTSGLQNPTGPLGTTSTSSTTIPPSYSGSGSANFNMMRMFGNMQTGAIQHTGMPTTSSSSDKVPTNKNSAPKGSQG